MKRTLEAVEREMIALEIGARGRSYSAAEKAALSLLREERADLINATRDRAKLEAAMDEAISQSNEEEC